MYIYNIIYTHMFHEIQYSVHVRSTGTCLIFTCLVATDKEIVIQVKYFCFTNRK